ncbi:cell wall metabolism sensor histidine kinase WalK [Staphylococcus hyicus]|uniref:Sensor histidine kinase n=1 Tax=Staphylococcus hyicus TaxID=1284 RepID=A0ACD5FQ80_STAHY|nr:HAMP domain-containing sensor histidine kinase [Staphylococcus hyicus]AJC95330.1 signal transduction histidine kinase HssS [Staphylococcus hyicus]MCE5153884.1 HAMP domain-containing histidine kinase [Staphylococcus hyicus]MCQ9291336.1 HAMP domain-containing histidine kinase [Staphylococcus hyicus]MCQ9306577.1 HAMP domain-containing histidine kinase [Staphylococcus hyicus]MCQ9308990.1 HAMP domain-containing histidine kinase [Staphylococcus hyicus]
MLKSLYTRVALYTLTVMIISAIASFLLSNIYYHFELKSQNDAKLMSTLQHAHAYDRASNEKELHEYFKLLGHLNYQLKVYDTSHHSRFYGEPFRKDNISSSAVDKVLNGEDYHGVKMRPFNPIITGFFDNETQNTVGTSFKTNDKTYAVFMRQDVGQALGEFRIFLFVLLLLLVSFSIALVIWSTYSIVKPVKQLKIATQRMMDGDFKTPIAKTREDEIGTLQVHFDSMRRALKQLDDMRQHFVQNVSHEIKTPLTHIHHILSQLQVETSKSKQSQYIQQIYDETHRLSQLTRQLLLLSELDNDEHLAFDDTVPLKDTILEIIKHESYNLNQKNIVLLHDLSSLQVKGNQRLLTQAIENVIRNAIKYTHQDGMIEVTLNRNPENNAAILTISDDGPGISANAQQHIFDRFYKSTSHTDSNGLGLAITQDIIVRHRGNITVSSILGEGATFTIRLPLV